MAKSQTYQAYNFLNAGSGNLPDRAAKTNYKLMVDALKELKIVEPTYEIGKVSPYYKGLIENLKKVRDAGDNPQELIESLGGLTKSRYTPESVKRYSTFAKVLWYTGARPSDINALRPKDIDFKNKLVYLDGLNKTNLQRVVPLSDSLAKVLKERIKDIGLDKKSYKGKFIFAVNPKTDTSKTIVQSGDFDAYLDKVVKSQYNDIDPSFFEGIDPDTNQRVKKSYLFRQGVASLVGNSNFLERSVLVKDILGHTGVGMQAHYNERVLKWANTPDSQLVDLVLDEDDISNFDSYWNFNQRSKIVREYHTEELKNIATRKKLATPIEGVKVKTPKERISEYQAALQERVYGSNETFRQNVVPQGGATEEFLRAIDTGAPLPKTVDPVKNVPVVEGGTTKSGRGRAKRVKPESRHFAIWRQQQKDQNAFSALLNKGSQSKVLVDLPMDLNTGKQTIEGILNSINSSEYMQKVDFEINNIISGITENTEVGYRNAADYLPFNHKGVPDWNKNQSLLNYIFSPSSQRVNTTTGAAAIRLDGNVLRDLLETVEYNNRVDTIAKKFMDQFDYLATPTDVADDYVARTAYGVDRMALSIDKFIQDNPNLKLDIAFDYKQATINTDKFMSDVSKRLQGVLLEQEYAPINSMDVDNVIARHVGTAFSEVDDNIAKKFTNNKSDNLLNRIRLQPYVDALIEVGVLDNVVYEAGKEFAEDVDFDKPFSNKLKYKNNGDIKATQKNYSIDLRTNFFSTAFKESLPSNIMTLTDADKMDYTIRGPIVDFLDENGKEPKMKAGRFADTFIDTTKKAGKTFGGDAIKNIAIAGFGMLAGTNVFAKTAKVGLGLAVDGTLETAMVNPDNIGKGIYGDRLYEDLPEYYSANKKVVNQKLDDMSVDEVVDVIRSTDAPTENVSFGKMFSNKAKELGRFITAAGSAMGSSQARQDLFTPTVKELDKREAEGDAREIVENISEREISQYVPEQQADIDRRRADAEQLMEEYGGTILTDKIRNPRLEKIQKGLAEKDLEETQDIIEQMNNLDLSTTNQKEKNDAVNARLQTG
jgi:hypothetical protein